MRQIKKTIAFLGLLLFFSVQTVHASSFNFSVTTIQSERQINQEVSYFDILLKPDETEILKVYLRNDTNEERTIEVSIKSADTNDNGVVEYSSESIDTDISLRYNISDYVSYEKEINIPSHSTIELPITVWSPDASFDGIIAGGISFKEKIETVKEETSSGIGIQNEFSYEVALLIRQNKTLPNADLKLLDVAPGQLNYQNVIYAKLQNPVARYLNRLAIQAEVYRGGQLVYATEKTALQMAPNTNFSFPIDLNGDKLKAGSYELKLYASTQTTDNSKESEWFFTEQFEIAEEEAQKNNQTVVKKKMKIESYALISILFNLILIPILLVVFLKKKRKK